MKKVLLVSVSLVLLILVHAQQAMTIAAIPAERAFHHENIVQSLNAALAQLTDADARQQDVVTDIKAVVTKMRTSIETDNRLDNNAKFKWLRGINEMLTGFVYRVHTQHLTPALLPALVKAYDEAMHFDIDGKSIGPVIHHNGAQICNLLIENYALQANDGAKDVKAGQQKTTDMLASLNNNLSGLSADSLIVRAAFRDPDAVYNHAAASDALGLKIRSVDHRLVKIIAAMAIMKAGRMYFPFLDRIYKGEITIADIKPLVEKENDKAYFSLLVQTRISYADRMQHLDTPVAVNALTCKLRSKAIELFINDINALHDQQNQTVRFKKLEGLSAQELYYIAVMGEEEIYTSSFVSGLYPRIMKHLRGAGSETLFESVHHDYDRKFIKSCASYNTLDHFLAAMDENSAQAVISAFVDDLEKTTSLEDAVDVADSYGSISNKDLRQLIRDRVAFQLDQSHGLRNRRGENIYQLLSTVFRSMDTTAKMDVTQNLGIQPIYSMPAESLKDDQKRVIIQQFFYGDKDGQEYFHLFLDQFENNPNWKIIKKSNWVEIRSVKGSPVSIFSNLPLDEKKELDTRSQDSLISYLAKNKINPSVVIHRGHSYYLKYTIARLPHSAKVIVVGSCGGYQNLNQILDACPEAHIISSKQVGMGIINQGMINLITEKLRLNEDLDWPSIWSSLSARFTGNTEEKFDDYIPPYKNLGAIFVSAYTKTEKQQQGLSAGTY